MRDPAAATHLDEATRDLLNLSDEQRIACIDRDLWIGYGRAKEAHSRLDRVLCSQRRMRPDNLLIVGASNNGKTAIVDHVRQAGVICGVVEVAIGQVAMVAMLVGTASMVGGVSSAMASVCM